MALGSLLTLSGAACQKSTDTAAPSRAILAAPVPRWAAAMEALHVPGMAVAVVGPDGPVLLEAIGRRDLEANLPVTAETLFYIASTTKPFVALATCLLEDSGAIDLNRPVRTYLPRFALADFTETNTITVRDLLAHRRGLQDLQITFVEAFSGQMTEERFYRLLTKVRAVGELDYSNLHYTLLGRIIAAVSGISWKEYVEGEVLRPAGMARSTTRAAPLTEDADAAVPYEFLDGQLRAVRTKTDSTMHAAGGMLSTASDLARWIRIHLEEGRLDGVTIFPAAVIRAMQTPQIYEEDPSPVIPEHRRIGWGLGWDIREDRNSRLFYHSGSYTGWAAHMSFMPEIGTGVVVLANRRTAGVWLAHLVAADVYDRVRGLKPRDFLPRLVSMREADEQRGTPQQRGGPTLPVERYVGTYVNDDDWGTLEVWTVANELRARIGALPLPLVWTGADSFIADQDHAGTFDLDPTGRVTSMSLGNLAEEGPVWFVRR